MSKARLVITAVVVEHRTQAEVAVEYGVSKGWVSKLVARYRADGEAAFEPRSSRPKTSPRATPATTLELVVGIRKRLLEEGLDAGPDTIRWHLQHHHAVAVSRSTVARILSTQGLVTPEPKKRPRSSYLRFEAEQPNETWQSDFTHYRLAGPGGGADVEILTWLDDHSRFALSVTAHHRVTGPIVLHTFRETVARHGIPASTLTDNGLVFTTRLAGGRGGRNGLEGVLASLASVAGQSDGVDHAVVGERRRWNPVPGKGFSKRCDHDRGGGPLVCGDVQGVAGAVVEPADDLDVRARSAAGTGEPVVGEVGLPGLVRHRCLEADVGGLRSLGRVRAQLTGPDQDPVDRGP